jgi:mono/diheme cytochrome c family protein
MRLSLVKILMFVALVQILTGCNGPASESTSTLQSQAEPIIPNLPSISELAGTPAPIIPSLPTLSRDEIALGQQVYAENCVECHGENLEGEADWQMQNEDDSFRSPPHDASGHTWHHGDKVLVESIALGGPRLPDNIGGFSNMPAFGDTLTEGEIAAVLTYIKSTWPEDLRRTQWEQTIQEKNQ